MSDTSELAILLLHALPLDRQMWSKQMSLLPGRTHAPNLYDFGSSIEHWAEQSLSVTSSRRLIVVGCSVGGSCALEVAHLASDRIAALVLVGTKADHHPDPDSFQTSIKLVHAHGVDAAWKEYWEPLFRSSQDRRIVSKAKRIAMEQSPQQLANGLSAFHTRPSRASLVATCGFPVHVVTGDHDTLPGMDYCRNLAASAPEGFFHPIRGSGHYVPMVQPQEFNALLSDIIETHSVD